MTNNTTFKPLSLFERERIGVYLAQGKSKREIGKLLRRSHTTISRELKRNRQPHPLMQGYIGCLAHQQAKNRKKNGGKRCRLKSVDMQFYVQNHLKTGWSPEQIANRLALEKKRRCISHEAIYQYVYSDWKEGIAYLARRHPYRYTKGYQRKRKRPPIEKRVGIDERPAYINTRKRGGHWECDLIVSDHNTSAIQVLHERVSRFIQLTWLPNKKARTAKEALLLKLGALPKEARKSITYDNGSENYCHHEVNAELKTKSYFCNPYHSWEKGAVENTNSLIRRFIPKKTDLSIISKQEVKLIEKRLNERPRKCLKFKTPSEVFYKLYGASPY